MRKAADRALSRMHNSTWVKELRIRVRITRTISKPYTLILTPLSGNFSFITLVKLFIVFLITIFVSVPSLWTHSTSVGFSLVFLLLLLWRWPGKYRDIIEIDLVPAFEIPVDLLPRRTRKRVREVEERMGVKEDLCLAIAMPIVSKKKLEVK